MNFSSREAGQAHGLEGCGEQSGGVSLAAGAGGETKSAGLPEKRRPFCV